MVSVDIKRNVYLHGCTLLSKNGTCFVIQTNNRNGSLNNDSAQDGGSGIYAKKEMDG